MQFFVIDQIKNLEITYPNFFVKYLQSNPSLNFSKFHLNTYIQYATLFHDTYLYFSAFKHIKSIN